MREVLIEAEFEDTPVRHAYVTCPECGRKFNVHDALGMRERPLLHASELGWTDYHCPICKAVFGGDRGDEIKVEEVGYPKCAKGAYKKKEVWKMSE